MARFASVHGVQLKKAEVDVRAEFDRASQVDGGPPAAAHRVTYSLDIVSDAPMEAVQAVVRESEAACYTLQSLRLPVEVQGAAKVNGSPVP